MTGFLITLIAVGLISSVHLLGYRLRALEQSPFYFLLISFAAGTSIAYVVLHLIPHIANESGEIASSLDDFFGRQDIGIYTIVLVGILVYFGVRALSTTPNPEQYEAWEVASSFAFIFSIAMFSIGNVSMGHLMHERSALGIEFVLLFALAIALHYLVIDNNLRQKHGDAYIRYGRWVLIGAIATGWLLGYIINLSRAGFAVLMAFIIGGIILNTLKMELSGNIRLSYTAFVAGAVSYGIFIILVIQ